LVSSTLTPIVTALIGSKCKIGLLGACNAPNALKHQSSKGNQQSSRLNSSIVEKPSKSHWGPCLTCQDVHDKALSKWLFLPPITWLCHWADISSFWTFLDKFVIWVRLSFRRVFLLYIKSIQDCFFFWKKCTIRVNWCVRNSSRCARCTPCHDILR
jgi:hypothetical protein